MTLTARDLLDRMSSEREAYDHAHLRALLVSTADQTEAGGPSAHHEGEGRTPSKQ
jgi:hypothetical protein